jgi:hypothetical protein
MIEEQVHEPEAPPSIHDELLKKIQDLLRGMVAERIKASVDRAMEWTFHRVIVYLTAAVVFSVAATFLMLAGSEGLKQAGLPSWGAFLALGFVGLLGGTALLKSLRDRKSP